jgi:MFS family permease
MLKLIRNDPLIRRLSLVQFISYFGSWFSNVAIYTLILQFGVDPFTNALVVSMYALPAFLAPLNGAIVDKFEFKRFMLILLFIELSMTLAYLFIHDISQVTLLMFFIFIRTTASLLFFNAEMSMLPQLFSGEKLKNVNQLHSVIWSITYALGMAIGGIAVDRIGIYNTILIDAVLFCIAIYLFHSIKFYIRKKTTQNIHTLIREGFQYLKKHKLLLHLIFLHSAVAFTSFDALINLLTDMRYKYIIAIPLAIGWLNGTRALGLMVGPLVIGKIVKTKNLHLFFIGQGIIILLWSLTEHNFYLSLCMMFLVGFFTTTLWSYTYTLVQTHTEPEYLGRVVAYNDMIFMVGSIIVTLFTGAAFKAGISLEIITAILGIGFILSGFYFHWFQKSYHYFLKQ